MAIYADEQRGRFNAHIVDKLIPAVRQPRLGKRLKDLSTPELNALIAGFNRVLDMPNRMPNSDARLALEIHLKPFSDLAAKIHSELTERGNPLVTR